MTTETPVAPFHRDLDDHVSVEVTDVFAGVDPDIAPRPDDRPAGRVVVTMPDFVADTLSHVIRNAHTVAALLTWSRVEDVDADAPSLDLAEALYEASCLHGYVCDRGDQHGRDVPQ
jgi:hypothetical protein